MAAEMSFHVLLPICCFSPSFHFQNHKRKIFKRTFAFIRFVLHVFPILSCVLNTTPISAMRTHRRNAAGTDARLEEAEARRGAVASPPESHKKSAGSRFVTTGSCALSPSGTPVERRRGGHHPASASLLPGPSPSRSAITPKRQAPEESSDDGAGNTIPWRNLYVASSFNFF